ncbi:S26 family signal peptidase [Nonomuraea sp. LPB2021202275-12-8]|uniref:S26 family signal peptidase n=1 Tax=Nonomuraea sp. LPB2021202275-12-8 TaxID=3120159 RepID=UPI00300C5800
MGILVGGLLLISALRRLFVVVTVVGDSMLPAYRCGDRVLVRRRGLRHIRSRDVVVVRMPLGVPNHQWVIKRAAAVPGDGVPATLRASLPSGEGAVVPAGRLLVLGDNSEWSTDSRHVGYLHGFDVLGLVVRRLPAAPAPTTRDPHRA